MNRYIRKTKELHKQLLFNYEINSPIYGLIQTWAIFILLCLEHNAGICIIRDIYYLTRYERGIHDAPEASNLKSATFYNGQWLSDYLGKPGFYYGFDTSGKVYDWQINDTGISIFGYQRSGDLSSDERKKTFGYYRIELKGHHHELVTP